MTLAFLIVVVAVITWPFVMMLQSGKRFKTWAEQDEQMCEQWWFAYERGDYDECRRLNYVTGKNWEALSATPPERTTQP